MSPAARYTSRRRAADGLIIRICTPCFYASDAEAGAIAEAFGRFPEWTPAILAGSPALPGSARAIAAYRLDENAVICNLDDGAQLNSLDLRPSDIVSRDYTRTRDWARRLFRDGR